MRKDYNVLLLLFKLGEFTPKLFGPTVKSEHQNSWAACLPSPRTLKMLSAESLTIADRFKQNCCG